jgi:hypothetical protein
LGEIEFIETITRSAKPKFEKDGSRLSDRFAGTAHHKPSALEGLSQILSCKPIKAKLMPSLEHRL